MSDTAIPCTSDTRDRLRRLKERRELTWEELLNQMADEVSGAELSGGDLEDRVSELERRVNDIESLATR